MNYGDHKPPEALDGYAVDFVFLAAQTFGDRRLQRDVLELFLTQARRLLARLPVSCSSEQVEVAHLLKGSCQGIGAWAAASASQVFEDAAPDARSAAFTRMSAAFADAEAAIKTHLASL